MRKYMLTAVSLALVFGFGWSLLAKNSDRPKSTDLTSPKVSHRTGLLGIQTPSPPVSVVSTSDEEAIPLSVPIERNYVSNRRLLKGASPGIRDTLDYGLPLTVNFGMFPGDIMYLIYPAPTDLILEGVGIDLFDTAEVAIADLTVEVFRPDYPLDTDGKVYAANVLDVAGWLGFWHDATGADSTAFPDSAQGLLWNEFPGDTAYCAGTMVYPNAAPVMGEKLFPTSPFINMTIDATGARKIHWLNFADFAAATDFPTFEAGEYIGIAVTYSAGDADERVGILSSVGTSLYPPHTGTKFYKEECDGTSGEAGWHIRQYTWHYPLAVELTGDRPPIVRETAPLPTTLSTADRDFWAHLTDDNPSGEAAGVASATFLYSTDDMATWSSVSLSLTDGTAEDGTWSGTVPGQSIGTGVYWIVAAVDVGGNSDTTVVEFYTIFESIEPNLIFNNTAPLYGDLGNVPFYYMYMIDVPTDIWDASYGDLVDELVGNYGTIIELTGQEGPWYYGADSLLQDWWLSKKRNYIASGDEWLGVRYGWPGTMDLIDVPAGDFARDVLGVSEYFVDISDWANNGVGISRLTPIAGDPISGPLHSFLADSLLLNYDPNYEIEADNWLDGITVADGATVSMTGWSGVIDSSGAPPDTAVEYSMAVYYEHAHGSKSAFFAFDIMSLNTMPAATFVLHKHPGQGYYWIGANGIIHDLVYGNPVAVGTSPLRNAMDWMGLKVSVDDEVALIPNRFALHQNYPNPFNPVTTISFDLASDNEVTLVIYNLLGQKVITLVNDNRRAGVHSVTWDGKDALGREVGTGVYIFRMVTSSYSSAKKMVLLK